MLHETNQIDLFGLTTVNPGYISSLAVTVILLVIGLCIRIFAIPRFKYVPGRLQMFLEQVVGLFDGLAKSSSPWRNSFLGAYIFAAGVYIFSSTLFELFGFQVIATSGHSVALPAPLLDINAAIMLGVLSYFIIVSGAMAGNGIRGDRKGSDGSIAADLHEFQVVRSTFQRHAGDGAGVLLCGSQFRHIGDECRYVHIAPCADTELCGHHADGAVLRRNVRAIP